MLMQSIGELPSIRNDENHDRIEFRALLTQYGTRLHLEDQTVVYAKIMPRPGGRLSLLAQEPLEIAGVVLSGEEGLVLDQPQVQGHGGLI